MDSLHTDQTWRYAWPGGRRLAAVLSEVASCRDQRVADLGCGAGLLGMTAAGLGARSVTFADGSPEAVAGVEQRLKEAPITAITACVTHAWGDPIPGAPFDLILGGDILYRSAFFPPLLTSIAVSLTPDGRALLMDPRLQLEAELPDLARQHGLSWTILRRSEGWGTLAELRGQAP